MFWDPTMLIVLPALIFAIWAQINVKTTYTKYNSLYTQCGMTGYDAARRILDENGLYDISIEQIPGELSDHYDPKAKVIRLSQKVYTSSSAAAVGIASHEAGHAVQHAKNYFPIRIRQAIIPITQFGSSAAMPLFLIGMIFASATLMYLGIAFYSLAVLFQLVTLPVEFNASARAMKAIRTSGRLTDKEMQASRRVLTAAALTYVAAMASSLLSLLRLIIIAGSGRRR
ncbi:MAG: zinc metallopeptidase [Clostridia bacterium]|nr:zinc metallopeptidase [Clostridia bacterium]